MKARVHAPSGTKDLDEGVDEVEALKDRGYGGEAAGMKVNSADWLGARVAFEPAAQAAAAAKGAAGVVTVNSEERE